MTHAPTDRFGEQFCVGGLYVCSTDERVYECIDVVDGHVARTRLGIDDFADDEPVALFKDVYGFSRCLMGHTRWMREEAGESYSPVAEELILEALGS